MTEEKYDELRFNAVIQLLLAKQATDKSVFGSGTPEYKRYIINECIEIAGAAMDACNLNTYLDPDINEIGGYVGQ